MRPARRPPGNWLRSQPPRSPAARWRCRKRALPRGHGLGRWRRGIATATGFGVVKVSAACCASAVGSVAELASVADVSVDFAAPSFGDVDLAEVCWAVLVPLALVASALPLPLEGGPAPASLLLLLFGSLPGGWLAGGALADPLLLAAGGGELSERRCGAGCCWAADAAASLPVLLSTSEPKISLADDGSDRAGLCCAPWKATLAAASDVTLNTGARPFAMELDLRSARTGPPGPAKNINVFQYLTTEPSQLRRCRGGPFSARRQDLPFTLRQKRVAVIASRQYGLY